MKLLDQVLVKFYWLRGQSELRKKPSTSELVDWISALLRAGITQQQIEESIPFLGSLLKNWLSCVTDCRSPQCSLSLRYQPNSTMASCWKTCGAAILWLE